MRVILKTATSLKGMVQLTIVFLFSIIFLYIPYSYNVSICLQLAVIILMILWAKIPSLYFPIIILFSTTPSYISVSTSSAFQNYFSLNSIISILLLIICSAAQIILNKGKIIHKRNINFSIIGFGVLALVSTIWSVKTAEYTPIFILVMLIYISVSNWKLCDIDIKIIELGFVLSGILYTIGTVPHILHYGSMYQSDVIGDRNYISGFILINILVTAVFIIRHLKELKTRYIIICVVSIIVNSALLLLTGSRSGFIALIFGAALLALMNLKKFKSLLIITIVFISILFFVQQFGLADIVLLRFQESNVLSGNGRIPLMQLYFNNFIGSNVLEILFGHGFVSLSFFPLVSHNTFVSIIFSFGCVGLLCFISAIFKSIRGIFKSDYKLYIVPLVTILFMSLMIEPYYRTEFALLFSFICAISTIANRSKL